MDGSEAVLLTAYNEVKEEAEDYSGNLPDQRPELAANVFIEETRESDYLFIVISEHMT